jgi:tellurite resistance protein
METKGELLGDRRRALEEEFFRRQDERLRERLRAEEHRRAEKAELSTASGITDDVLLTKLLALGIHARTLAPLALVPLVEVAWADGKLEDKERAAVLRAAEASGLQADSPGYGLLGGWLATRPDPGLRELWTQYTRSLCATLDADARRALRADIMGRARTVAEAAGGFLGLGSKVSAAEDAVLSELAQAFGD